MIKDSISAALMVEKAATILRNGGIVAFPTETVYGLGADALNAQAVARIFEAKGRPRFDPLIVHIADRGEAESLVTKISDKAAYLMEHFWPGPLTLILPKASHVPDIVTAGLSGVGIRMPDHPLARDIIRNARTPVAAPSANRFGAISPTTAQHVLDQLADTVDLVVDGGPCAVGVESTIISFMDADPILLRPGGLPLESIGREIGTVRIPAPGDLRNASPGRLARHYAPRTKLVIGGCRADFPRDLNIGLLTLTPPPESGDFSVVEVLSVAGNLNEAACNLFAAMRRLDAMALDGIIASLVPDTGLGRAINDRLRRAAAESDD